MRAVTASTVAAIACLLLVWACEPCTAAVTTAGAAAHAIPERQPEEELPDYVVRPFDDVLFQWELRYDAPTRTERIVGQFNFTNDEWLGIGFQSSKRMNGPIAACWITAAGTEVDCADYVGTDYLKPSPRGGALLTEPVLAGAAAEANFIRFETIIAMNVGPSPAMLSNGTDGSTEPDYSAANFTLLDGSGFMRVLFAKGGWTDATRAEWKQHHTENSIALSIDWRTGQKEKLDSKMHRIVFYELAAISVGVVVISFLERHPPRPRSPIRRRFFAIGAILVYLALLIQYIFFRYVDYRKNVVGKAHVRAFGDGAVFCLGTMALPVGKKLLFSNILLVSHERAIKYHALVGVLLLICGFVHGVGMTYYFGVDGVTRWKTKDSQSRMPGLLTYIVILFVVVPAFLRHFFWRWFRLLHYTYILVFALATLHYPYTGVALAPGAVLHLLGIFSRRFLISHLTGDNLDRVSYDEPSGVISMDFVRSDCILAGSWFTVCFPEISQVEQHPFSACRLLLVNEGKTTIVRLFAKVNKADPKSWTARVARHIQEVKEKEPHNDPVFTKYRLYGPYGVLEVSPKTYRHILLVAGGMGITPHLLMLQQILINDAHSMGPTALRLTVTVLWAVREPALLEVFIHDLANLEQKLKTAHGHILVRFKVFCTAPETPEYKAQLAPNPYVPKMGITVHRRPDFEAELDELAGEWAKHVQMRVAVEQREAAAAGKKPAPGGAPAKAPPSEADAHVENYSVATYVSGPAEFQKAADAALSKRHGEFVFHVHHEGFRL